MSFGGGTSLRKEIILFENLKIQQPFVPGDRPGMVENGKAISTNLAQGKDSSICSHHTWKWWEVWLGHCHWRQRSSCWSGFESRWDHLVLPSGKTRACLGQFRRFLPHHTIRLEQKRIEELGLELVWSRSNKQWSYGSGGAWVTWWLECLAGAGSTVPTALKEPRKWIGRMSAIAAVCPSL